MNIVRASFMALALGASALVNAQTISTVTPLQRAVLASNYQESCTAIAFNADDSVYGVCSYKSYQACAGRGCQPTVHTFNYNTNWDLNGNVTSAVECDEVTTHAPQAPVYVYFNGNTSCPVAVSNPYHEVTYVYYDTYSWAYNTYYFLGISADGLYTLVPQGIVYPATQGVPQS